MKYFVDLQSLLKFKTKRDIIKNCKNNIFRNSNKSNISCTKHSYLESIPKILTKDGWKCVQCDVFI